MQNNILILNSAKNNPNAEPTAWRSFSDLANTLACEYASHQNDEYIANILAFLSPHYLNKTIYLYLF